MWAFCFSGEQHAPNKTNLLPPRLGILDVEVEESTIVMNQKDSDVVISKDAAKRLIEILKDFVE